MALQRSVAVRNACLDQVETTIGTAPVLRIYTGSQPANCAAAATGTLLVSMTLPSDWMQAASAGTKSLLGSWTANASASGTAGYYRIWDSGVANAHEQGSITGIGGGGQMEIQNTSVNVNQPVTVTAYTWTAGNA